MENWTEKDFEIYVLIYAAHCNLQESLKELQVLLSQFNKDEFDVIYHEILKDSPETSLKKITTFLSENDLSFNRKNEILQNVKKIFFADGTIDSIEKETFAILKKLLN